MKMLLRGGDLMSLCGTDITLLMFDKILAPLGGPFEILKRSLQYTTYQWVKFNYMNYSSLL
jgi:hypothetical protein